MKNMKVDRRLGTAGSLAMLVLFSCQAIGSGLDPLVPFNYRIMGVDQCVSEIRSIRETTGLRRFLLTGPGFNDVMFAPFGEDVYPNIGKDVAAVRRAVAGTDIEISW